MDKKDTRPRAKMVNGKIICQADDKLASLTIRENRPIKTVAKVHGNDVLIMEATHKSIFD